MNYEMLRDIARAKRGALLLLGLILFGSLAAWGYGAFVAEPALDRAQNELAAARRNASGAAAGTPAARYRAAEADLKLFRERVLDKKSFPAFLSRLFEDAQRNALSLKQVSYKPTVVKDQGLLSYDIGFTVSGHYGSVKSFIADLTRTPEMVTLDSVSLMNPSPTEERIDLRVQITAYLKTEGA
ncbi:type 4a pilus biogenesis protein PilO [Geomesophilobacter sediminis]|uniref:Type 4a pilus biogenesis protein PilO n=1 Tax=Geomesophilobacter sediminis TaxID=2798584 RepID=A0A8J7J0W5_9BACT|nr:type 4a pilus biogenesis protein PilO [Geomesophilobacter sediminis]MBJ6726332.1 type 4a pilus biogenesis protein PilO [Geomesophilobacter sediminis]